MAIIWYGGFAGIKTPEFSFSPGSVPVVGKLQPYPTAIKKIKSVPVLIKAGNGFVRKNIMEKVKYGGK
jgi:hypothetical protein